MNTSFYRNYRVVLKGSKLKIAVVGLGYVGLSNAVLLAQQNEVVAVDVMQSRVDDVNDKRSPIADTVIEEYLASKSPNLTATMNAQEAYQDADYTIIANRASEALADVAEKAYSRDVYARD